ncbi:hypothetical protein Ciccas_013037, partial [Cichlidogyrus casuarinus]
MTNGQAGDPVTSNVLTLTSSYVPPPQIDNNVNATAAVAGQDGNNQVYNPSLADPNSPEFIAITNNLCSSMATFISNAPGNYWVSKCSILSLSPGSVMALTNMVVSQLQNSTSSVSKAFDPSGTIASGMARTPPSQVALLLDSESLKATFEIKNETTTTAASASTASSTITGTSVSEMSSTTMTPTASTTTGMTSTTMTPTGSTA